MRTFIIATTVAAALFSSPAFAQQPSQGTASIPDLSGLWGNPYLYGIEPPLSGPGPVVNRCGGATSTLMAAATGLPARSNPIQLVGDYTNPILKPAGRGGREEDGEMSLAGAGYPSPRNQCWPQGVPFIFTNAALQLLQQPDKITMLYERGS